MPPECKVPIALLGRLAVDKSAQGQGLGERLLFDALFRAQQVASQMGTFALVVDALNDQAAQFYLRYGFKTLADDPRHLYLSIKEIRKLNLHPGFGGEAV